MRLKTTDTIAGIPAPTARDVFRQMGPFERSLGFFVGHLAAGEEETRQALDRLVQDGYLMVNDQWWYRTAVAGRVAAASFNRPMKRKTADRLLQEVIARVREGNANPGFFYRFDRVAVFGSYLGDGEHLGDLDLAVERTLRPGYTTDDVRKEAERRGYDFWTGFERVQNEINHYVRSRNGYISLHTWETLESLEIPYRIIYPEAE